MAKYHYTRKEVGTVLGGITRERVRQLIIKRQLVECALGVTSESLEALAELRINGEYPRKYVAPYDEASHVQCAELKQLRKQERIKENSRIQGQKYRATVPIEIRRAHTAERNAKVKARRESDPAYNEEFLEKQRRRNRIRYNNNPDVRKRMAAASTKYHKRKMAEDPAYKERFYTYQSEYSKKKRLENPEYREKMRKTARENYHRAMQDPVKAAKMRKANRESYRRRMQDPEKAKKRKETDRKRYLRKK